MRIGLIDVDSHNFPNLALMKISSYHKSMGDTVEWWAGDLEHYDVVYKARVFSDEYSKDTPDPENVGKLIKGGTGYGLENRLSPEIECCYPDYDLYFHLTKNTAYGFLTRGCPCNCQFCIVGKKEGLCSRKVADLSQFWSRQGQIKLLDPNLLACQEHIDLIGQLAYSRARVDFTQGLDARCITRENARALSKVKTDMVHFAFDFINNEQEVCRGLEIYKEETNINPRKTGVYILTNYNTTHEEDMHRVKRVQELGYMPYIMVYNKPTAPQITRDLQRWSNNRWIYEGSGKDFSRYNRREDPEKYGQIRWEV